MSRTLALLLVLSACKSKPPTLAERMRARLVEMMPSAKVTVVDDVTLKVKGDSESQINLDNLQLKCADGEDACKKAIEMQAASIRDVMTHDPAAEKLDPAKLRPTLKPVEWVKNANVMMAKAPDKTKISLLLSEPFAADVAMTFVLDQPNGMRMLQTRDLDTLKLDQKQLRALALKNLEAAFPAISMTAMADTGVWTNERGDDYDAALLTVPAVWKPYAQKLAKGESLIVSIPSRNRVFMARAPGGLAALRKITDIANGKEDHPISKALFKWSESGFSEYAEHH